MELVEWMRLCGWLSFGCIFLGFVFGFFLDELAIQITFTGLGIITMIAALAFTMLAIEEAKEADKND